MKFIFVSDFSPEENDKLKGESILKSEIYKKNVFKNIHNSSTYVWNYSPSSFLQFVAVSSSSYLFK
jgi:hypothetical protein